MPTTNKLVGSVKVSTTVVLLTSQKCFYLLLLLVYSILSHSFMLLYQLLHLLTDLFPFQSCMNYRQVNLKQVFDT